MEIAEWLRILVAAVVGFLLAQVSAAVAHRRDTRARREERNARSRHLRDDFQLRALVELQDAVGQLLRTTEEIHWARRQASWSKPDQWFTTPDVVEDAIRLDAEYATTRSQIPRLTVRVRGVEAGNFARTVKWACEKCVEAGSEAKSSDALKRARDCFEEFNRRVGAMMDKLWIDEESS